MKKYLVFLMALIFIFGMFGCSDGAQEVNDENREPYKLEEAKTVEVGDSILFGSYEQDNNTSNGKEDIEWIVLEKTDGRVLVISKYILDCQPFNLIDKSVTWEDCTLRQWLNYEFFNTAFTAEEQERIPLMELAMWDYGTESLFDGNATQDRVFLLSQAEIDKYLIFDDSSSRDDQLRTWMTTYVRVKIGTDALNSSSWWSRSAYNIHNNFGGTLAFSHGGIKQDASNVGVRPAMWIMLDE